MSHTGRGMFEYGRPPFPGGRGRGKGDGVWGDRHPSVGRPQSIDEEIDILNEEDEDIEREREKVCVCVFVFVCVCTCVSMIGVGREEESERWLWEGGRRIEMMELLVIPEAQEIPTILWVV